MKRKLKKLIKTIKDNKIASAALALAAFDAYAIYETQKAVSYLYETMGVLIGMLFQGR